jgi:hypothetical protein
MGNRFFLWVILLITLTAVFAPAQPARIALIQLEAPRSNLANRFSQRSGSYRCRAARCDPT